MLKIDHFDESVSISSLWEIRHQTGADLLNLLNGVGNFRRYGKKNEMQMKLQTRYWCYTRHNGRYKKIKKSGMK
jgi:hypothetical protein